MDDIVESEEIDVENMEATKLVMFSKDRQARQATDRQGRRQPESPLSSLSNLDIEDVSHFFGGSAF